MRITIMGVLVLVGGILLVVFVVNQLQLGAMESQSQDQ